jgi:hypothetical protein
LEGVAAGSRVALEGIEYGLGFERGQIGAVLGVGLQQQGVDLVPQACGFGDGSFTLARQKVENGRVVLRVDAGECRGFLSH